MATLRAMQAAGEKVTAAAPMSGPYALEAFGDVIFFGGVDLGSTEFAPLLANSYQHAYGNVDSTTMPLFSSIYPDAETLLPSDTPIDTIFARRSAAGDGTVRAARRRSWPVSAELTALLGVPPTPALPASAQTPIFQLGFGNPYLINNDFRVAYAEDAARGSRRRGADSDAGRAACRGRTDIRIAPGLLGERHAHGMGARVAHAPLRR